MNRTYWCVVGGIAVGVLGAALLYHNREKVKPMASKLMAQALRLKEKALDYAARVREHSEDVMAEARYLNENTARLETPETTE